MSWTELLLLLIVAGIAGAIGRGVAGDSRGGIIVSIALGFVGAVLGSWMATQMGLPELLMVRVGGRPFPVVWAILGAALFVAVLFALQRRRPVPP
jgi:uncharacterized membrane protein YeaQ/YmgE (transglycosylase-associated protein family)